MGIYEWSLHNEDEIAGMIRNRLANSPQYVQEAITILLAYGDVDGSHHKMWAIDQAVRKLAGDAYDDVISDIKSGEDGPDTYGWDEGIAP